MLYSVLAGLICTTSNVNPDNSRYFCSKRFKVSLFILLSTTNAAARLTTGACKYDHGMPLLKDLHWLRVLERITYKLCLLVHKLSPRYGATLPTRRYPACRCNLAPSSAVDIFIRPGSSGYETNYDQRPRFRCRGTTSMEQSSSVRYRLLVSWHLQKISQDLFVFAVILEHRTAHY